MPLLPVEKSIILIFNNNNKIRFTTAFLGITIQPLLLLSLTF
jgi:hypothetical protein